MCLLVVLFRMHPDAPLIVAANRDELLARPADAMSVLEASRPRVLGGRDRVAGGTWLAVNEHGVVAGLTNAPRSRDPARRSRGELPLLAARRREAEEAARELSLLRGSDYNPCWLLVADRRSLYHADFTTGERVTVRELEPGLHVLENRPLLASSPKADQVRRRVAAISEARGPALIDALHGVLKSHEVPVASGASKVAAACVHAGSYGTRSSEIVFVGSDASPQLWSSEGPPCVNELVEVTSMWGGELSGGER